MKFKRLLDLFGKYLLSPCVDAIGSPSKQIDGAICLNRCHIPYEGVALAIDFFEGLGGLFGIFVVTQWHHAALGHHADLTGTGHDLAAAIRQQYFCHG